MLEIGIIGIVVVAVGYWVTLWLMGRHDDVLHGDFVHPEQAAEASMPLLPASPFPPKPSPGKPSPGKVFLAKSTAANSPAGEAVAANLRAAQAASKPARPDRLDTLQSLLASIKRDLKDAAQL